MADSGNIVPNTVFGTLVQASKDTNSTGRSRHRRSNALGKPEDFAAVANSQGLAIEPRVFLTEVSSGRAPGEESADEISPLLKGKSWLRDDAKLQDILAAQYLMQGKSWAGTENEEYFLEALGFVIRYIAVCFKHKIQSAVEVSVLLKNIRLHATEEYTGDQSISISSVTCKMLEKSQGFIDICIALLDILKDVSPEKNEDTRCDHWEDALDGFSDMKAYREVFAELSWRGTLEVLEWRQKLEKQIFQDKLDSLDIENENEVKTQIRRVFINKQIAEKELILQKNPDAMSQEEKRFCSFTRGKKFSEYKQLLVKAVVDIIEEQLLASRQEQTTAEQSTLNQQMLLTSDGTKEDGHAIHSP